MPGQPCARLGPGRVVCKGRLVAAVIEVRRQDKAAQRTLEKAEALAGLPKIPKSEFAAITTERRPPCTN